MIDSLSNLLGVVGADFSAPITVADFFTYFFNVLLAFCVISGLLQLIRFSIACIIKGGRNL